MPRVSAEVHWKMGNICSVLLQVNMIGMHVVHILFYVPMKIHESKPRAIIHEYVESTRYI